MGVGKYPLGYHSKIVVPGVLPQTFLLVCSNTKEVVSNLRPFGNGQIGIDWTPVAGLILTLVDLTQLWLQKIRERRTTPAAFTSGTLP